MTTIQCRGSTCGGGDIAVKQICLEEYEIGPRVGTVIKIPSDDPRHGTGPFASWF